MNNELVIEEMANTVADITSHISELEENGISMTIDKDTPYKFINMLNMSTFEGNVTLENVRNKILSSEGAKTNPAEADFFGLLLSMAERMSHVTGNTQMKNNN